MTVGAVAYALWLTSGALVRARANGQVRRQQKSAGHSYGQVGSVFGGVRVPRLGTTFWFLLLVCGAILYALWWK